MVKSDDPEKEKNASDNFADDVMSEIESQQEETPRDLEEQEEKSK